MLQTITDTSRPQGEVIRPCQLLEVVHVIKGTIFKTQDYLSRQLDGMNGVSHKGEIISDSYIVNINPTLPN